MRVPPLTRQAKQLGAVIAALVVLTVNVAYWRSFRRQVVATNEVVWSLDSGELSQDSSCYGLNQSPGLRIDSVPAGTQSLAVTLQRDGKVYWMVWDVPVQDSLQPGVKPDGSVGRNLEGNFRYAGPCPERGVRETYQVRVYAVPVSSLRISSSASLEALEERLGELKASYSEKELSFVQEK